MPYQVTMDRTLSETDIDRLIQSELSRRKYNTVHTDNTNEEFITTWKADLAAFQERFPTGRFRNIRWQAPTAGATASALMNPEDPLGLEAHPTNNTCPIIFTSFCHPCMFNEASYEFYTSDSMIEQIQNDWEMNGQTGDFRKNLGITDMALWNDNPATGETSADIVMRKSLLPHEKGFASDPDKISLVPLIEFFKSIGVTHHGYFVLGAQPKKFTLKVRVDKETTHETINGKSREESPSDFPWPWIYGAVEEQELSFIPQHLNCEDAVVNGPEIIQDYGWPGTK